MKKIIAILALFLAFSVTSNAQETKKAVTTQRSATDDAKELSTTVKMDDSLLKDFTTLLSMRADALSSAATEADRKAIFERFAKKMQGGLSQEQLEQLKTNKALYESLMVYKK